MRRFTPRPPPAPPPGDWKPEVCEEPGCGAKHPPLSHDGTKGPWRCGPCHRRTGPKAAEVLIERPSNDGADFNTAADRLL